MWLPRKRPSNTPPLTDLYPISCVPKGRKPVCSKLPHLERSAYLVSQCAVRPSFPGNSRLQTLEPRDFGTLVRQHLKCCAPLSKHGPSAWREQLPSKVAERACFGTCKRLYSTACNSTRIDLLIFNEHYAWQPEDGNKPHAHDADG